MLWGCCKGGLGKGLKHGPCQAGIEPCRLPVTSWLLKQACSQTWALRPADLCLEATCRSHWCGFQTGRRDGP